MAEYSISDENLLAAAKAVIFLEDYNVTELCFIFPNNLETNYVKDITEILLNHLNKSNVSKIYLDKKPQCYLIG